MKVSEFINKIKRVFKKEKQEEITINQPEKERKPIKRYPTIFNRLENMNLGHQAVVVKGIYADDSFEEGWELFLSSLIECDFFLNDPEVVAIYELSDNIYGQHASVWEFSKDTKINPNIDQQWNSEFFDWPENFIKNYRCYYVSGQVNN